MTEVDTCRQQFGEYYRLVFFCTLLFCLLNIGSVNAGMHDKTVKINNSSLEISFDVHSSRITSWRVKDIFQTNHSAPPFIRDLAYPANHYVSLKGLVRGKKLDEWASRWGGWQIAQQTSTSITFELSSSDGQFAIRQHWLLSETSPWQTIYKIEFNSSAVNKFKDRLWLEIGPGVGEFPKADLGFADNLYSFTDVVYLNQSDSVSSIKLNKSNSSTENLIVGSWLGLQSRYFAFVVAPLDDNNTSETWVAYTPPIPTNNVPAGFDQIIRINLSVPEGSTKMTWNWSLYGGGKAYSTLTTAQPNLSGLLYQGLWDWMRFLTLGLMHALIVIENIIGNWGFAIIVLAVIVRIVLHPLAKRMLVSQKHFIALQEKIKPQLSEIKQKYKGGEQSERILRLYEKNKTSPFAGLKPLLIVMLQLPIFIALYHLLGQLFELRDQPFLWIATLAEPDKFFSLGTNLPFFGAYFNFLPVLLALSTIASIKLSPAPASDRKSSARQNIFFAFITLGFFLLFYSFPAGMVLYWTAANLLHLAHILYVQKRDS